MERIELIGLRTVFYDEIKTSVLTYIELYQIKIELVETNDLRSILSNGYTSIPLVLFNDKKLYFKESNHVLALKELSELLKSHSKKPKKHTCKNCGSCNCPTDLDIKEKSDAK